MDREMRSRLLNGGAVGGVIARAVFCAAGGRWQHSHAGGFGSNMNGKNNIKKMPQTESESCDQTATRE